MGAFRSKMKVLIEGPLLTRSGYGEHARLVFEAIRNYPGIQIYAKCVNWGSTSWTSWYDDELHECIVRNSEYLSECNKHGKNAVYDIQIFVGILNEFQKCGNKSVVVTAGIETDRVSAEWLMKIQQGVDKIIVPSQHSKSGFTDTSYSFVNNKTGEEGILECNIPVDVIAYPVKDVESVDVKLELDTKFNFLNVVLLGPRKNLENSVEWFLEEFRDDPEVGLILKTAKSRGSVMDRIATMKYLEDIKKRYSDAKCKVYLLHGNLSEEEIHALYKHPNIHALVSATCGEGFGLPLFEAAYSGMPVIATDWSAHPEFLVAPYKEGGKIKDKKLFAKVKYTLAKIPQNIVWKDILIEDSRWAYADPSSYKEQMRKVYKNYGMYKKWASTLQEHINSNFTKENTLNKIIDSIFKEEEEGTNEQIIL